MRANTYLRLGIKQWVICVAVLAGFLAIGMSAAGEYQLYNLYCSVVELPRHEAALGFETGDVPLPDGTTGWGIVSVEEGSPLAKAGVRAGDIPQVHHGLADFCGELSAFRDGRGAEFRVIDGAQRRRSNWTGREIVLPEGQHR